MDYEAIDREMSLWVVTCVHNERRFFLANDFCATDILSRAQRFRDESRARDIADIERKDEAWHGQFDWQPMSRAEVSGLALGA